MGGECACMGQKRIAHRVLLGKPEVNSVPRRPTLRLEDNIKIGSKLTAWEAVD
jgi:hypothetical protein